MSQLTPQSLYELLPAVHRIRDEAHGAPLQALLSVVAEQGAIVEQDIARLVDNWFIETCEDWVIPYIADLLGVRGLHSLPGLNQRARVANTLAYRRRKGTATMLEQLARDTTGWPARAVEFFQILGWNQHYNHIRPNAHRTPDLRRTHELELLHTAFDSATHTIDVRRIAIDRGRHNIPNVGFFLWRLQSYFLNGAIAAEGAQPGFYTFSPLAGQDRPLFNSPQSEPEIAHLADETNVSGMLRRRPLWDELEDRRAAILAGATPRGVWFSTKSAVLRVFEQTSAVAPFTFAEIPPERIRICHLGTGAVRPEPVDEHGNPILVGVDPVLGRLAWAKGLALPIALKVSCAYGFSGDLGGGPYDRRDSVEVVLQQRAAAKRTIQWQVGVSSEAVPAATGQIFTSLAVAIVDWHLQPAGTFGVIVIMDSHTYAGNLAITIPEGSELLIVAAAWPAIPQEGGLPIRIDGRINPVGVRPHLRGNITLAGDAPANSESPGAFAIDGLLIEGSLTVLQVPGNLGRLRVAHSTLVPAKGGLTVEDANLRLRIEIVRSIVGPISLPATAPALRAEDSIIDAGGNNALAITADASEVDIQNSTVFGQVTARKLHAGNSIFTGLITVARRQEGCVRFCFVPDGSQTGRRFRCQPDLALAAAPNATAEAAVLLRVVPIFTAEDYGHPAYTQLATTCPPELKSGAEDGEEMGAFRFLLQPQREANLRASLPEYLSFGLEAGIIFAT